MKEIIEKLKEEFGDNIPDPSNYPKTFEYYLIIYKYIRQRKKNE